MAAIIKLFCAQHPCLFYHVRDFLIYQEQNHKLALEQLTASDASNFINELGKLTGVRTKKLYSSNHLNKYVQALHLFSKYIRETGKSDIGFMIERKQASRAAPCWLTKAEIQPGLLLPMLTRAME